jgi:hypothetical protein
VVAAVLRCAVVTHIASVEYSTYVFTWLCNACIPFIDTHLAPNHVKGIVIIIGAGGENIKRLGMKVQKVNRLLLISGIRNICVEMKIRGIIFKVSKSVYSVSLRVSFRQHLIEIKSSYSTIVNYVNDCCRHHRQLSFQWKPVWWKVIGDITCSNGDLDFPG